jgi:hypothetical protein
MSFRIKDFCTIRISASDISKSRDWYRALFDLEPVEDSNNFVSFKINGICFDIAAADSKSPVSPSGTVGYWLVDNLDGLLAKA